MFVFKDPHANGLNNVQLGIFGRNRTNVRDYPGSHSLTKELKLHPTPKNVAMIADAIRDVTPHNGIVLDPFSGSGTTIIAAEQRAAPRVSLTLTRLCRRGRPPLAR